jgi:hypothetical protein
MAFPSCSCYRFSAKPQHTKKTIKIVSNNRNIGGVMPERRTGKRSQRGLL